MFILIIYESYKEFGDNTVYIMHEKWHQQKSPGLTKVHDDAVYLFQSLADSLFRVWRVKTVGWSHDWTKTFPAKTALNVLNQNLYIYWVELATNCCWEIILPQKWLWKTCKV